MLSNCWLFPKVALGINLVTQLTGNLEMYIGNTVTNWSAIWQLARQAS